MPGHHVPAESVSHSQRPFQIEHGARPFAGEIGSGHGLVEHVTFKLLCTALDDG
jgi:hypothetical protein